MNTYLSNSLTSNSCQQLQLNIKPTTAIPILSKSSTDFASVLWSKQLSQDTRQRTVSTINDSIVDNKFTSLSVQSTEHGGMKVLPVVTPPPPLNVTTTIPPIEQRDACPRSTKRSGPSRLNKFVRRLHEMLASEQNSGIVEWRKGLLVLHSTHAFTKNILPKYFGTKNFKTFRRQLNYYGFVHVRSFSATGSTTTALWVNQDLAKRGTKSISSVLMLKRVEPSESSKTAEGRRVRKEEAASTVEDIGINTRTLQLEQIRKLAVKGLDEQKQEEKASPPVIAPRPIRQVSQNGAEYASSDASSTVSTSTASSPVPAPVHSTFPCTSATSITTAATTTSPDNSTSSRGFFNDEIVPKKVVSSNDTSADDAANLLILLSRSAFSK
mmetsp:Transcript_23468/g.34902  ORF Transcript_23468/g.34902 Transcript_23468/m.34902 type:complete len:382 (+) Transcript_23468:179-1324(+)